MKKMILFLIITISLIFLLGCEENAKDITSVDVVDEDTEEDTANKDIEQTYCDEPRPENCIQVYEPVCGSDGVTYSNGCVACSSKRVDWHTQGEC